MPKIIKRKATDWSSEKEKDRDAEVIENLKTEKEDDDAHLTVQIERIKPAQTSSFFQNDLNAMTFLSGSQSSQAISVLANSL